MFGLKESPKPFQFDLEIDLEKDPDMAKKMIKTVEERIEKLKKLLRDGVDDEDFDDWGVLLHGYISLQRVLKRTMEKK